MTNDYKDLSDIEGEEINILKEGSLWLYRKPERAYFIKDYPKTILIEMIYVKSEWGNMGMKDPRRILKMIPKAALAVSDIIIRVKQTGRVLTGEEVTEYGNYNYCY